MKVSCSGDSAKLSLFATFSRLSASELMVSGRVAGEGEVEVARVAKVKPFRIEGGSCLRGFVCSAFEVVDSKTAGAMRRGEVPRFTSETADDLTNMSKGKTRQLSENPSDKITPD